MSRARSSKKPAIAPSLLNNLRDCVTRTRVERREIPIWIAHKAESTRDGSGKWPGVDITARNRSRVIDAGWECPRALRHVEGYDRPRRLAQKAMRTVPVRVVPCDGALCVDAES